MNIATNNRWINTESILFVIFFAKLKTLGNAYTNAKCFLLILLLAFSVGWK